MSWQADRILDAVEQWAYEDYTLFRETQAGVLIGSRIDGLLVPISFKTQRAKPTRWGGPWTDTMRLIGVEVKASRADFLAGLRKGQFERYEKTLGGLYIATEKGQVKTAEVPASCGHLVTWGWRRCVCRRRPVLREAHLSEASCWQLLMLMAAARREELGKLWKRQELAFEKLGRRASVMFSAAFERELAQGVLAFGGKGRKKEEGQ